jgi:hypothetical protein
MAAAHTQSAQMIKPLNYQRESTMTDRHGAVEVSVRDGYVSLHLPDVCSSCLSATENSWTVDTANGKLVLPICPECQRLWKRRRRILGLTCFLAVIASFAAFFVVVSLGAWQGLRGVMGFCIVLSMITPFIIFQHFASPIGSSSGRYAKNVRITFRNKDFARMLMREVVDC